MSNSSLPGALRTGVDQRADVDVARGDHAVEGRVDLLEALCLFQAPHVEGGGIHHGLLGLQVAHFVFDVLLRHGFGLQERFVARGGGPRQLVVGLGGGQVGAGLVELAVDFGRFDLGQQLAGLDVRADVEIPRFR